jgi:hypothetical protein
VTQKIAICLAAAAAIAWGALDIASSEAPAPRPDVGAAR